MSFVVRSLIVSLLLAPVLGACDRQSAPAGQGSANATAPVTSGEAAPAADTKPVMASIDRSHKGDPLPDFVFSDRAGKDVTLADFSGRPILVNLWATWCAPCVAEMPQLDTIAEAYGKDRLALLTISQDSQGADKVVPFFKSKGYKTIQPWLDPENQFGFHYATGMLPTSVLYDRDGKEVARVVGALDWASEQGVALIDEAAGAP